MTHTRLGSFMMALAIILSAFGTHGLRGKIADDLLRIYETANQSRLIHASGIILYSLWRDRESNAPKAWPIYLFFFGTLIFSGSLYLITFTQIRAFGAITPIGGLLYIIGWITFGLQAKSK